MSSKSYALISRSVIVALTLGAAVSNANAQGQFAGAWRVTETVKPDWIEPTSPPPTVPAEIGDVVEFGETFVRGNSPFSCENAKFEVLTLGASDYFGGGFNSSTDVKRIANEFGLANSAKTLRADCEIGVFDYHEGGGKLVLLFDNRVYKLERVQAKR